MRFAYESAPESNVVSKPLVVAAMDRTEGVSCFLLGLIQYCFEKADYRKTVLTVLMILTICFWVFSSKPCSSIICKFCRWNAASAAHQALIMVAHHRSAVWEHSSPDFNSFEYFAVFSAYTMFCIFWRHHGWTEFFANRFSTRNIFDLPLYSTCSRNSPERTKISEGKGENEQFPFQKLQEEWETYDRQSWN